MSEIYDKGPEWYPARPKSVGHDMPDSCECCDTALAYTPIEGTDKVACNLSKIHGNMWVCDECKAKELALQQANMTPEAQNNRVANANELMSINRQIDATIEVREDIHNANTVSIIALRDAINADDTVENKPLALATILKERYESFAKVIFEARETLVAAGNAQRAIHTYMASLSNQLRAEERAKLQLTDINYNPEKPKVIKPKSDKKPRATSKKFDIAKIQELLKPYNNPAMSTESIRIVMTSRGMSEEQAVGFMAKTLGLN